MSEQKKENKIVYQLMYLQRKRRNVFLVCVTTKYIKTLNLVPVPFSYNPNNILQIIISVLTFSFFSFFFSLFFFFIFVNTHDAIYNRTYV